jgi:ketopantoate hydroxymethyltransferase
METMRITVPELGRMKAAGERITMVTAYDWTFARLLDAAGVERCWSVTRSATSSRDTTRRSRSRSTRWSTTRGW